jgi:hypothetical protein
VTKKEPGKKPGEVTQDEGLTRRMAIKRIAAGLAGAGVVVVAGLISPKNPGYTDEIGKDPYADAANLPYGDKAPK